MKTEAKERPIIHDAFSMSRQAVNLSMEELFDRWVLEKQYRPLREASNRLKKQDPMLLLLINYFSKLMAEADSHYDKTALTIGMLIYDQALRLEASYRGGVVEKVRPELMDNLFSTTFFEIRDKENPNAQTQINPFIVNARGSFFSQEEPEFKRAFHELKVRNLPGSGEVHLFGIREIIRLDPNEFKSMFDGAAQMHYLHRRNFEEYKNHEGSAVFS